MHINNKLWLKDLKNTYHRSFKGVKVLELGSGTFDTKELVVRRYFDDCIYVGVDKTGIDGGNRGVDVIAEAKSTKFTKGTFDTLICVSMFEHDPDWKKSLSHNLQWVKDGGMIFISFGAEGNRPHMPYPWKPVPYLEFLKYCFRIGIDITDAFFEEERYGRNCAGSFNAVGIKSEPGRTKGHFFTVQRAPIRYRLTGVTDWVEMCKHKVRDALSL